MAGKVSEESLFEAERRMKICEKIVSAMTEEERVNPDMIIAMVSKSQSRICNAHINILHYTGSQEGGCQCSLCQAKAIVRGHGIAIR